MVWFTWQEESLDLLVLCWLGRVSDSFQKIQSTNISLMKIISQAKMKMNQIKGLPLTQNKKKCKLLKSQKTFLKLKRKKKRLFLLLELAIILRNLKNSIHKVNWTQRNKNNDLKIYPLMSFLTLKQSKKFMMIIIRLKLQSLMRNWSNRGSNKRLSYKI